MLRVQAGDLGAFEQLVERQQDMVYGLCLSILRSPEDAEEASQDAFLKLFRARDRFEPGRALEPWLLRIAGNVARDRLRRRRTAWLPTVTDAEGEAAAHNVPDPESIRTRRDHGLGGMVRQELDRLSEKVRVPLELKYLRGLSNQQIADALGISLSNVKVQVARGKDILQSRLGREVEG